MIALLASSCCQAQTTLTWDGTAGNGVWGGDNWLEGSYADDANLVFNNTDTSTTGNNLVTKLFGDGTTAANDRSPTSIAVSRTIGSVSITPGAGNNSHLLRLQSGGIEVQSAGSRLVIETDVRLRGGQDWRVQQPNAELVLRDGDFGANVLDLNGKRLTINGPGTTTVRTTIQDQSSENDGAIDKRGAGSLILTRANTVPGGLFINEGNLDFMPGASAGASTIHVNGANLRFVPTTEGAAGSVTLSNPIDLDRDNSDPNEGPAEVNVDNNINVFLGMTATLNGTLTGDWWTKRGEGILEVRGAVNTSDRIVVNSGTLRLGGNELITSGSDLVMDGGLFDLNSFNQSFAAVTGGADTAITLGSGTLTIGTGNGSSNYSGVISGAGGIRKIGNGTLFLGGDRNQYTGATAVENGLLRIGADEMISSDSDLVLSGDGRFDLNNFNQSFAGVTGGADTAISLGSGTLTVGIANASSTYSGVISGAGGIQKFGNGTFVLEGDNQYTGDTIVANGLLRLGGDGVVESVSDLVMSGDGRLDLNSFNQSFAAVTGGADTAITLGSGTLTIGTGNGSSNYSGVISGAGGIRKIGNGTLFLGGDRNQYTGATAVENGLLRIGADEMISSDSDLVLSGDGRFDLNNFNQSFAGVTGGADTAISLGSGTLTVGIANASSTYSGVISGSGGIRKIGSGTLTLDGNNSYTGGTSVERGILSGNTLNLQGDIELSGSATLVLNQDGAGVFSSNVTGSGTMIKSGSGDVFFSGPRSFSGLFDIQEGTVSGNNTSLSSAGTSTRIAAGATIAFIGSGDVLYGNSISGAGRVVMNKNPWNDLVLTGLNSYTGGTDVQSGSVVGDTTSIRGPITLAPGTLVRFQQESFGRFESSISGGGRLVKEGAGTLELNNDNTYVIESINVKDGVVVAPAGRTHSDVYVHPNALLELITDAGGPPEVFGGNISGPGNLRISGGSTLVFSGVLGGDGTIFGDVTSSGRVAPGNSPGRLLIDGDFTTLPGGVLEIEVGGLTPETEHDVVDASGVTTLGGALEFPLIDGFAPSLNDEITFINEGPTGGTVNLAVTPEAVFVPGLDALNNADLLTDPTGANDLAALVIGTASDVSLRFVDKGEISFTDAANQTADWFLGGGWSTGSVPTTIDETTVTGNFVGFGSQRVEVTGSGTTAEVHGLSVSDGVSEITVGVLSGNLLAATAGDVTIGDGGAIELLDGEVEVADTQQVAVNLGGLLSGRGTVAGDLRLGSGSGSAFAFSTAGAATGAGTASVATLAPGDTESGDTLGTLTVEGDYAQGMDGMLEIDISGAATSGLQDVLDITGEASLSGMLSLDLSGAAGQVTLGVPYEVLKYGSLSLVDSEFGAVSVGGADDLYAELEYGSTAASASFFDKGDLDGDGVIEDEELDIFAASLVATTDALVGEDAVCDGFCDSVFFLKLDFSGPGGLPDGRVDFADIPGLVAKLQQQGAPQQVAYSMVQNAYARALESPSVPEPGNATMLVTIAGLIAFRMPRKLSAGNTCHLAAKDRDTPLRPRRVA